VPQPVDTLTKGTPGQDLSVDEQERELRRRYREAYEDANRAPLGSPAFSDATARLRDAWRQLGNFSRTPRGRQMTRER
jgi:hypothetical protein